MIPWVIAIFMSGACIFFWIRAANCELHPMRQNLEGAAKQVELYRVLYNQALGDAEKRAYMHERYRECCRVYSRQAKEFNAKLQCLYYLPAAWYFRYTPISEGPEIQDKQTEREYITHVTKNSKCNLDL